ncbi:Hypothetical Protein NBC2815_02562 [Xanthomonas fragariae]|nr:Hypothetical Protein NBC2815_02562 [Xanthomonas fragariae]
MASHLQAHIAMRYRLIPALFLLTLGILFLLDHLGLARFDPDTLVAVGWQALLMAAGVRHPALPRKSDRDLPKATAAPLHQVRGKVTPVWPWYLPPRSLYEVSQTSSDWKNSICATPSLA